MVFLKGTSPNFSWKNHCPFVNPMNQNRKKRRMLTKPMKRFYGIYCKQLSIFSEKPKLHKAKMARDGLSYIGSNVRWRWQAVQDGGSSGVDLSFTMRTNSTRILLNYQNGDPKENICQKRRLIRLRPIAIWPIQEGSYNYKMAAGTIQPYTGSEDLKYQDIDQSVRMNVKPEAGRCLVDGTTRESRKYVMHRAAPAR
jgi:hypothetical protein